MIRFGVKISLLVVLSLRHTIFEFSVVCFFNRCAMFISCRICGNSAKLKILSPFVHFQVVRCDQIKSTEEKKNNRAEEFAEEFWKFGIFYGRKLGWKYLYKSLMTEKVHWHAKIFDKVNSPLDSASLEFSKNLHNFALEQHLELKFKVRY